MISLSEGARLTTAARQPQATWPAVPGRPAAGDASVQLPRNTVEHQQHQAAEYQQQAGDRLHAQQSPGGREPAGSDAINRPRRRTRRKRAQASASAGLSSACSVAISACLKAVKARRLKNSETMPAAKSGSPNRQPPPMRARAPTQAPPSAAYAASRHAQAGGGRRRGSRLFGFAWWISPSI